MGNIPSWPEKYIGFYAAETVSPGFDTRHAGKRPRLALDPCPKGSFFEPLPQGLEAKALAATFYFLNMGGSDCETAQQMLAKAFMIYKVPTIAAYIQGPDPNALQGPKALGNTAPSSGRANGMSFITFKFPLDKREEALDAVRFVHEKMREHVPGARTDLLEARARQEVDDRLASPGRSDGAAAPHQPGAPHHRLEGGTPAT